MELVNGHVSHPVMGTGVVIKQEADMLTINFPEYGDKRFVYPDAFEKDLKMCDSELDAVVTDDLKRRKTEIEAEQVHKQQLYEAELQSEANEKARLAALKKKSVSRTKSSTTKRVVRAEADKPEE